MSRFWNIAARIARPTAVAGIAAACLCTAAYAMRVSPMVVEMTTNGVGGTARIEVQNLNQVPLPFETQITEIHYDDQGNMTETPADAEFLTFPPQGLLQPGARQVVRLQWVGKPDMPASRAFYLSVNQIPVALAPGDAQSLGAKVQVVYHMKALVVVAPPKAAPKVEAVSAKPVMIAPKAAPGSTEPAKGEPVPGVEVVVRNTGTRYAMMAGSKWTVSGTGRDGKPLSVDLDQGDLNRDIGVGYLAPLNGIRTFQVPTGVAFGPGAIKVRFSQ